MGGKEDCETEGLGRWIEDGAGKVLVACRMISRTISGGRNGAGSPGFLKVESRACALAACSASVKRLQLNLVNAWLLARQPLMLFSPSNYGAVPVPRVCLPFSGLSLSPLVNKAVPKKQEKR